MDAEGNLFPTIFAAVVYSSGCFCHLRPNGSRCCNREIGKPKRTSFRKPLTGSWQVTPKDESGSTVFLGRSANSQRRSSKESKQQRLKPLVFLLAYFPKLKISLCSSGLVRCFSEHSWRTGACGYRFFRWIVLQIGDVVEVKFGDFVQHETVFMRTYIRSSISSSEDFPRFPLKVMFDLAEPNHLRTNLERAIAERFPLDHESSIVGHPRAQRSHNRPRWEKSCSYVGRARLRRRVICFYRVLCVKASTESKPP